MTNMTATRLFKNVVIWCTVGPVMGFICILCLFVAIFVSAITWLLCRDDTITFVGIYALHYRVIVSLCLSPMGIRAWV